MVPRFLSLSNIHDHLRAVRARLQEHFGLPECLASQVILANPQYNLCNEVMLHKSIANNAGDYWCVGPCHRRVEKSLDDLEYFTMLEIARCNTSPDACMDEVIDLISIICANDTKETIVFDYQASASRGAATLPRRKYNIGSKAVTQDIQGKEARRIYEYESAIHHMRMCDHYSPGDLLVLKGMPPDYLLPEMAMGTDRYEIYTTLETHGRLIELGNVYFHNFNTENRKHRGESEIDTAAKPWLHAGTSIVDIGIGVERCLMAAMGLKSIDSLQDLVEWTRLQ